MLKWFKRIAFGFLALAATLAMVGIGYEEWSRRHLARTLTPVGRLIDVGGHRLHLRCTGTGTPLVVLESGGDALGSQGWFAVRPKLAGTTRVCTYDRAGYGWSDTGPEPRDALTISTELHRMLRGASEPPPFVLVGHSLGGAFIRVFADRYPDDVAGLVFVDSSHPETEERLPPEMSLDRPIVRIAEWAFRVAARTGALRLMASL
ncbi:MAG: alpha/beta hydrolase, partial [Chloroflexi bacterium]|nr:alpha/beta hydrolase [Chloroflexota bacterium]